MKWIRVKPTRQPATAKVPHTCNADANDNCQLTQSIIHSSFIIVKCLPIRTSNEQTNGIKLLLNCHEFVFGDAAAACVRASNTHTRRTSDGVASPLCPISFWLVSICLRVSFALHGRRLALIPNSLMSLAMRIVLIPGETFNRCANKTVL